MSVTYLEDKQTDRQKGLSAARLQLLLYLDDTIVLRCLHEAIVAAMDRAIERATVAPIMQISANRKYLLNNCYFRSNLAGRPMYLRQNQEVIPLRYLP